MTAFGKGRERNIEMQEELKKTLAQIMDWQILINDKLDKLIKRLK